MNPTPAPYPSRPPVHTLLVDASPFMRRIFHAECTDLSELPPLFWARVTYLVQKHQVTHLVLVFDSPEPTFRHRIFPPYKAGRTTDPPTAELTASVRPYVQERNAATVLLPGWEADDPLAALGRRADRRGARATILTGDSDLFCLVTPRVEILWIERGRPLQILQESDILHRTGVLPRQILDWKTLSGDRSDGIPSIGHDKRCRDGSIRHFGFTPERAATLLQQHGSLREIIRSSALLPRKEWNWLRRAAPQIRQNRRLLRPYHRLLIPDLHPADASIGNLLHDFSPLPIRKEEETPEEIPEQTDQPPHPTSHFHLHPDR